MLKPIDSLKLARLRVASIANGLEDGNRRVGSFDNHTIEFAHEEVRLRQFSSSRANHDMAIVDLRDGFQARSHVYDFADRSVVIAPFRPTVSNHGATGVYANLD